MASVDMGCSRQEEASARHRDLDLFEGHGERLMVLVSNVAVEVISSRLWPRIPVKHGTLR